MTTSSESLRRSASTDVDAEAPLPWGNSWRSRPWTARLVLAFVVVTPFAVAQVAVIRIAHQWPRPDGFGPGALWWLTLSAVSFVVVEATLHLTRRLLPLASLLRVSLAFPAVAPSRLRVALVNNPDRIRESFDRIGPEHSGEDADRAYETMLGLIRALDGHDRLTRGHSDRVRAYTELLADELELSDAERHRLRWAGMLHDIGKLRVPAEILNKRTTLTRDEYETVKRHPVDGLALAAPLAPWLSSYTLAVSDHHERWDGAGYPSGLAGEEIARAGRMIAVVDAFDVMTSVRSYSTAVTIDAARAELLRCAGSHFDPEIVRAFLAVPVRRLRAVVGPLSLLSPLLGLRDQLPILLSKLGAAAGAIAVVGAASLVVGSNERAGTTARAGEVGGAPSDAADEVAGGGTATDEVTTPIEVLDDEVTRTRDEPPVGVDDAPAPLDPAPVQPTDTPSRPVPPGLQPDRTGSPDHGEGPQPTPSPPGPDGTKQDPQGPEERTDEQPVTVIVDPGANRVEIEGIVEEGLGIDLGPAGSIVCGGAGICDPIEVETPIVLP